MITTEKNPDGEILAETYVDTYGKTVRQKQNGLYTDYNYNRENHVIVSCQLGADPANTSPVITAYLYDQSGNASGQVLNPSYSTDTGTFVITDESLTQSMTHDSTGKVTSTTDGVGNKISYTYDAYGRVTSVTQPSAEGEEPNVTRYRYDEFDTQNKNGNTLNTVIDAMGRTSVMTYNMATQPVSISDKGDGTVSAITKNLSYDSKGRVSEQKGSLGTSVTYEYDGKDRVTTTHYKNASGIEEQRTSYTYDRSDNITSMTDYRVSGGTATQYYYTEYKYDRLKRLTALMELNTAKSSSALTAAEKEAATTKYSYDIDGNLMSVTYPKSDWKVKGLKYEYDQNKWLQNIKAVCSDEKEVTLRTYAYDTYGSVSEITDYRALSKIGERVSNPKSTICRYTYDVCRRPSSMTYVDSDTPETVKEAYTYGYDKNSRLVRETIQNLYPEQEENRQNEVRTYQYDVRGNLVRTEVTDQLHASNSHVISYTYDAVGNRLKQERTGGGAETTTYVYNSLSQLQSSETKGSDGVSRSTKAYSYDADGNQTRETDSVLGKETVNTYDAAGKLSACTITQTGKETIQQNNQYSGSGTRIQKVENGKTTNYFSGKGSVLYTTDDTGKGTSLNLQGASGNIIATARKENTGEGYYYYHKDPAGSTTNLRDADGKSVVSYQYTDFGETSIHGDADFYNEICYNESIYDKTTGLYYLSARFYNPEDGRFLTRDSYRGNATKPSTWNLYVYCANSPVNYDDPSGHIAISRIVGGVIGGAVGFWAGRKIAKRVKAKGWKKFAIIAGCTVGGAVVGAIAGPRVAKYAKKAMSFVKRKLPTIKKLAKKTWQKVRNLDRKTMSKTVKKVAKKMGMESAKGAVEGGIQNKLANQSVKKGMLSGAIGGAVGGLAKVIGGGIPSGGFKKAYIGITGGASAVVARVAVGDEVTPGSVVAGAVQNYLGEGFNILAKGLDGIGLVAKGMMKWAESVSNFTIGFIPVVTEQE